MTKGLFIFNISAPSWLLQSLLIAVVASPALATTTDSDHSARLQLVQSRGCASCHGTRGQGNSVMKGPRLAGQTTDALINKLKAYRDGINTNPTMAMMTYSLTDREIEQLATYFSQFP